MSEFHVTYHDLPNGQPLVAQIGELLEDVK